MAVTLRIRSSNTYVFSTETYPFFPAHWRQGGHISLSEPARSLAYVYDADGMLMANPRRRPNWPSRRDLRLKDLPGLAAVGRSYQRMNGVILITIPGIAASYCPARLCVQEVQLDVIPPGALD